MIQFKKIGAVGKIILNRPDKYNSFVREMALELQKILGICGGLPALTEAADSVF